MAGDGVQRNTTRAGRAEPTMEAAMTARKPRLKTLRPAIPTLGDRGGPARSTLWKTDAERGSATARGYGAAWRRLRALVMERDGGLCQACIERGLVVVATQVDHITPKSEGGSDALTNLRALCRPCHDEKSRREMTGGGVDLQGRGPR